MELHLVTHMVDGYAREDASQAGVVGAYTDPKTAALVARVAGFEAKVHTVEVDKVPEGLRRFAKELGLTLP